MASTAMDGYGGKTIGYLGSLCLLCNNICSAGMVQIPSMYQSAGWLVPTLVFLAVAGVSYVASLHIVRAVAWMPGNTRYEQRVEIAYLCEHLLPKWAYLTVVLGLVCSFMANNIASIVVSAQVMDSTLIATVKKTCALVIYQLSDSSGGNGTDTSRLSTFTCLSSDPDNVVMDSPFGDAYVISLGYLIVMVVAIPLGYLNLDQNIWVQVGGVFLLMLCIIVWTLQFSVMGLSADNMPVVDSSGFGSLLAGVVFNYGFVATVPSWLNEKGEGIGVSRPMLYAVVAATLMYLCLGFFGGFAIPAAIMNNADILSVLDGNSLDGVWVVSQIATYIFPIANLLSSIPVFSILIRYNLLNSGLCRKWSANLIAVVLPWILSLFVYIGNDLNQLTNWASALLFVAINLVLPFLLFIIQYRRRFGLSHLSIWEGWGRAGGGGGVSGGGGGGGVGSGGGKGGKVMGGRGEDTSSVVVAYGAINTSDGDAAEREFRDVSAGFKSYSNSTTGSATSLLGESGGGGVGGGGVRGGGGSSSGRATPNHGLKDSDLNVVTFLSSSGSVGSEHLMHSQEAEAYAAVLGSSTSSAGMVGVGGGGVGGVSGKVVAVKRGVITTVTAAQNPPGPPTYATIPVSTSNSANSIARAPSPYAAVAPPPPQQQEQQQQYGDSERQPLLSSTNGRPSLVLDAGEREEEGGEVRLLPRWVVDRVIDEYRMAFLWTGLTVGLGLLAIALQIQTASGG